MTSVDSTGKLVSRWEMPFSHPNSHGGACTSTIRFLARPWKPASGANQGIIRHADGMFQDQDVRSLSHALQHSPASCWHSRHSPARSNAGHATHMQLEEIFPTGRAAVLSACCCRSLPGQRLFDSSPGGLSDCCGECPILVVLGLLLLCCSANLSAARGYFRRGNSCQCQCQCESLVRLPRKRAAAGPEAALLPDLPSALEMAMPITGKPPGPCQTIRWTATRRLPLPSSLGQHRRLRKSLGSPRWRHSPFP
ncbi:hypothetical protein BCR34DRAFT_587453 [Clohesyomyces aquaticus]|uniref:Uncharacterized protein n=1 Tax=Clohesyomyces aquaticus TaxID=1231657 RepID=A0A1Y1ZPF7_9PLEO|nr:hypothetical protein BCR34DRAFT_587453 [Clohesyomyces aquaticus]